MFKRWHVLLLSVLFITVLAACSGDNDNGNSSNGDSDVVTIKYWQYEFASKVDLMDELIKEFEEANPGIKVEQTTFPYDNYNEQVAAQVPAGKGPDVINLFYGWVPSYVDAGYLQPLPQEDFPHDEIEAEFFPLVQATKMDGEYWTIPTAVRTAALFYNKDLFEEAGLDPNSPPETWEELADYAVKLTKKDGDRLEQSGMAWEPAQQGHHWLRDGLTYQAGGEVLSEDRKTVVWGDSDAGLEAFKYWLSFPTELGTSEVGFYTDDVTAFMTGKAAMNVDGSFRLGTLQRDAENLNYAVAPMPGKDGIQSTNASFWTNGITKDVEGEKLEASIKFLKFLTSQDVMERWLDATGELPAKEEVAMQDKYVNDELYGPFINSLPFANAHFFVDETKERELVIDAANKVLLEGMDVEEAFNELVEKTQALYDEYWGDK
ncbi:extracellular solute-binding protein [Ornithinibacillus halotolerans]|uniref:Sugar ABC transporter substrate-binding protein n=1 Tax=Ornithinibacillus halotolerans TaxID=1274357 RepID=A0A916WA18_9BACI|nr:extracellular solute-binding protein [Ornithinibacillus halotolerans]GGA79325.1 sugar ABC transporter substrate-binding protein [Ornithinibacillus halotolerans]